jgi:hypothetical protein
VSVLGRPRKWPGGAVLMSVYLPPDLKEELATRAAIRHMSLSEYALNLMLKGLDIEKDEEAKKNGKAEEAD